MSIITVFGRTLITLPTFPPAPTTIEYRANNIVGANRSPYTAQRQGYNWKQGWWEWSVNYPPMVEDYAQNWVAFLLQLVGSTNVFQIGDPRKTAPRGSGAGAPYVFGDNPSQTYFLGSAGWTPNAAGVLLPGDYLQVGYRLYRATAQVDADSLGEATIPIWPPIREIPNGGSGSPPVYDPIVLHNTKGLFELKSNSSDWMQDVDRYYKQIVFEIREAL